jgi:phage tail-like protein
VAWRAGLAPDKATLASARLALASLALTSDRRQPQSSAIERVRFFEGQLLDEEDLSTEVEYERCLKIVRPRRKMHSVDGFRYQVLIDGLLVAGFDEVDGLAVGGGFIGQLMRQVRKLLGLRKYTSIILKRGHVADRTLADWYSDIQAGRTDRRAVVIKRTEPSSRGEWRVSDAWIEKIEGPGLNASGSDVAIESLELAYEKFCVHSPA